MPARSRGDTASRRKKTCTDAPNPISLGKELSTQ
jgi:hypothetical protein